MVLFIEKIELKVFTVYLMMNILKNMVYGILKIKKQKKNLKMKFLIQLFQMQFFAWIETSLPHSSSTQAIF